LLGTTCHFGLRSKYRCFRYYRKSELNGECYVEAYFMEAIKVIPEIIKVKGRGLLLSLTLTSVLGERR
jgi:hypothetical protein